MADEVSLSDPAEVVIAFAAAYTRWERDMTVAENRFHDAALQQRHAGILLSYCTHKKRACVDGIASFSEPPTYRKVTGDNIASVEQMSHSRTHVDTTHLDRHAYRFVLLKKQDGWRIDSVKWRFGPDEEWENTLIGS
jgi:hypothetical protein